MGLFENLGRRVERFKREVEAQADEEATHRCAECEAMLYTESDECPECGSSAIEAIETDAD